jgi:hypothetical protein
VVVQPPAARDGRTGREADDTAGDQADRPADDGAGDRAERGIARAFLRRGGHRRQADARRYDAVTTAMMMILFMAPPFPVEIIPNRE